MVKYKLHVCFFQRDIFKATVNAGQNIGDTKNSPWDTSLSNVCVIIRATAFEIFGLNIEIWVSPILKTLPVIFLKIT